MLDLLHAVPNNTFTDIPCKEYIDWIKSDKRLCSQRTEGERIILIISNPQEAQVQKA